MSWNHCIVSIDEYKISDIRLARNSVAVLLSRNSMNTYKSFGNCVKTESKMKCIECSVEYRKYKCPRCMQYCCSFECFKKHKEVDCSSAPNADELTEESSLKQEQSNKKILQFTTDDTVHPDRLAELANSELLKDLLKNKHLRDFIKEVDSAPNAWKAMQFAMLEPLFIEFADECMKVVEPNDNPSGSS